MPVTELYAFNLICENLLAALYGVALTISEQEINDFVEKFLASIPEIFKIKFKAPRSGYLKSFLAHLLLIFLGPQLFLMCEV